MSRLTALVVKHPWVTVSVTIIASLLLATGIPKVTINDNLKDMLPEHTESRKVLDELTDTFGGSDFIMVIIGSETGTIFNSSTLAKVNRISESMETVTGIEEVRDITNLNKIEGKEWGLEVTPFMEDVPETQDEIRKLEEDIFADNTYVGSFVSEDKKYAAVLGFLEVDAVEPQVYQEVLSAVKSEEGPEDIYVAGVPALRSIVARDIKGDMKKLLPLVILVLALVLYLAIGTRLGVMLTMLVIVLSVLPTVGLMGHLHRQFAVVTNAMPVILLALACADSIHVISRYYREAALGNSSKEAVIRTMRDMNLPVVLTSVTTMAGFLSMLTSPIPRLMEFGVFISFGVFWALVLSLTMLPAFLVILKPKAKRRKWEILPDKALISFGKRVVRYRAIVVLTTSALVVLLALGIWQVKIETNPERFFSENSQVAKASRISDNHLGGSANISIMLKGDIKSPQTLNQMLELQEFIETLGDVGTVFSIANIVSKINKAINDNDPRYEAIPETREAVAQALLLYSMSGDPSDFERFVDNDYSAAQMTARFREFDTTKLSRVAKQLKEYYGTHMMDVDVRPTGTVIFVAELAGMVVRSSITSIISSIIMVFLISAIVYRSLKLGILCIIPLSIAVILSFGIMGFTGIELSMPTAIISCITIGVGIDYAIHCTARYRTLQMEGRSEDAASTVVAEVGGPVLFNAFSVAAGFAVLVFSNFVPVRFFGGLVFISMLASAFGALTILVALLDIVKPVRVG
jgi:predicted RND superfamily exporter protein